MACWSFRAIAVERDTNVRNGTVGLCAMAAPCEEGPVIEWQRAWKKRKTGFAMEPWATAERESYRGKAKASLVPQTLMLAYLSRFSHWAFRFQPTSAGRCWPIVLAPFFKL